jgi:hypothetical protein
MMNNSSFPILILSIMDSCPLNIRPYCPIVLKKYVKDRSKMMKMTTF